MNRKNENKGYLRVLCFREGSNLISERGIKHKLQEVRLSEPAGGFQYHISLLRTIETDTDQNKKKRGLPCCEERGPVHC